MTENEKIEIDLIIQAIFLKYGYDFRAYSKASIRRRVMQKFKMSDFKTLSDMQHTILNDQRFFESLLGVMTINVTEMFRDPSFFKAVRDIVLPEARKNKVLKIWNAGCATGEEVYSLAILLQEKNLINKTTLYATDIDENAIKKAKEGIFDLSKLKEFAQNYLDSGGRSSFTDYFTVKYNHALVDSSLKKNIVFFNHNLVTDNVFSEVDIIICRNVLIYFDLTLQNRVFKLFWESLNSGGILCLGSKESIAFSDYKKKFKPMIGEEKIFIKTS